VSLAKGDIVLVPFPFTDLRGYLKSNIGRISNGFCPPNPPNFGGKDLKVPQNWGASPILAAPVEEELAWI
jgi:hypothetical protein